MTDDHMETITAETDNPTVCITHGRFIPCRNEDWHHFTDNPYWVKSVRDFQGSDDPNLTWEPATLTITDPAAIRASDDPDEGATVPPGLDLAAIKDTAKRAAFGWGAEWRDERVPEGPDCEWFTVHADGKRDMVGSEDGDVARHIAGMDPAATLALVARVEAAEAKVAAVEARVGEWESDRDVCLAWIADPAMHADEGHPDRLSRVADSLDRHARAMRAALATAGEGQ